MFCNGLRIEYIIILYLAVPTLGTMLDIIDISRASFIIYLIC